MYSQSDLRPPRSSTGVIVTSPDAWSGDEGARTHDSVPTRPQALLTLGPRVLDLRKTFVVNPETQDQ